jgi:hypothetical protein
MAAHLAYGFLESSLDLTPSDPQKPMTMNLAAQYTENAPDPNFETLKL